MRCWWATLLLTGCLFDNDPPQLIELVPNDGVDRSGVGSISIEARYRDASDVTARVFVDGEYIGTAPRTDCDGERGCTVQLDWDTIDWPPGYHDVTMALEDSADNVTTRTHQVLLDDVLVITAMELANTSDESGSLEIEVYAFGEGLQMIGCAGSRHGLGTVDYDMVAYNTNAVLITPDGGPFGTTDVEGILQLEVWEDDDDPVCPDPLVREYNDLVGASIARTVDEWRAMPRVSFGNVTNLSTTWARPLSEGEIVDPARPDTDPFDGDGAGCRTTRAGSGGSATLVMVAMALCVRRRRTHRLART